MSLHPLISQMFATMAQAGRAGLSAGTPADARALTAASRAAFGAGPELHRVQNLRIATRSGSIAARLLQPAAEVKALVVYLHGGGWVVGELDDYDAMARTLAARSGCALLMPDYRLAPEHRFPAALEDAEDAIRWAAAHAPELVGAPVPLLVGGDSAGANLATVAVHELFGQLGQLGQSSQSGQSGQLDQLDRCDRLAVAGQLLIYPVTDADFTRASYLSCSQGMQLTREDMQWFFRHYAPPELHTDPRISPLRRLAHGGLPPTVVITAECDVLRDEGEAYAARLAAAGVPVTARRMDSLPHGFIRLHNLVDVADTALSTIAADLARLATEAGTENPSPMQF